MERQLALAGRKRLQEQLLLTWVAIINDKLSCVLMLENKLAIFAEA